MIADLILVCPALKEPGEAGKLRDGMRGGKVYDLRLQFIHYYTKTGRR